MKNCATPSKTCGLPPAPGRSRASSRTGKRVEINGSSFHCHGYIAELDAWVVLGFDPRENPQICPPGAKLSVRAEWAVKRTLFRAFCR
jgi:hypothetical protein